jgi:hypothetical protein
MSVMFNPSNKGDERTDTWLTPPHVIEALGGADSFDLDPCAPIIQPWPTARQVYTEMDNGLLLPWDGRVWLNPPYTTKLLVGFMERMALHDHGVALIFAKTETRMFFEYVWSRATAVLFIRGRLDFHRGDGSTAHNSGSPSVLASYGFDDADVLAAGTLPGQFVPLRIPRAWLIEIRDRSWRQALSEFFEGREEPVTLDQIYRAFASDPKSQRNRHWREKIRQTLQRDHTRIARGVWKRNIAQSRED